VVRGPTGPMIRKRECDKTASLKGMGEDDSETESSSSEKKSSEVSEGYLWMVGGRNKKWQEANAKTESILKSTERIKGGLSVRLKKGEKIHRGGFIWKDGIEAKGGRERKDL